MRMKKILAITAVEVHGSLMVNASISLTSEEGLTCTRRRELFYDVEQESCCIDDWVGEVCGTLDDPNEAHAWVYEHGPGCQQHEGGHHGE